MNFIVYNIINVCDEKFQNLKLKGIVDKWNFFNK